MEQGNKQKEMDNNSKKSEENAESDDSERLHQFPFLSTWFTNIIISRKNKQRKTPLYSDNEKKKEYNKMFPRAVCRLASKKLLSWNEN